MKYDLIILSIVVWGLALSAGAQGLGVVNSFSMDISPKFPEPLSEAKAKLTSFSFDIDRASIQWILNGRTISRGIGVKEISFEVGPLGSVSTLRAIISPQGGGTIEKTLEIRPQEIDMLIEGAGYIPPWYRGAAVVTPASQVKVVAIPNFVFQGSRLDPRSLVYNWKVDNVVRGDLSGRGKQSVDLRAPALPGARTKIEVEISSPLETLKHRALTFIQTQSPELLFYERRPLEGIITSEALRVKTIPAGENLEVQAVPFFMNFSSLGELNFNWNFDGETVLPNSREPDVFLVKSQEGTAGEAFIRLIVNNLRNVLETISASFRVYVE